MARKGLMSDECYNGFDDYGYDENLCCKCKNENFVEGSDGRLIFDCKKGTVCDYEEKDD